MKTWDKLEVLIDKLGAEEILESLCKALGECELEDNLNYIARMWDVQFEEEEEE